MLVTARDFEDCLDALRAAPEIVWDLETTGLDPHAGDRLFGVAAGGFYFPFRHQSEHGNLSLALLPALLDVLTDPGKTLIGFNSIRFDGPMLAAEGERYEQRMLHPGGPRQVDVMVDALLANENERSFSLDALGQKYLGRPSKHDEQARMLALVKDRLGLKRARKNVLMGQLSILAPHEVAPYACADVKDTKDLRQVYAAHLEKWVLTSLSYEMYDFARLLARVQWRGLSVDPALCEEREATCLAEQRVVLQEIQQVTGPEFNPQSPAQVCRLLGTEDAEADTLRASGHPLAEQIIRFKRLGKMAKTYYRAMLDRRDGEGTIHPQLNLTASPHQKGGARTGRLSCSNPNFQNLPKRSKQEFMQVRDCVVARPGHVLIALDYEGAERWLGAHYSRDESLADAYHAGRDLYQEMADEAGHGDRAEGKADYLAIQYGARGRRISERHGWTFESIEEIEKDVGREMAAWGDPEWRRYKSQPGPRVVDSFFAICPGIKEKMQEVTKVAEECGSIRLWTGRALHFNTWKARPWKAWNGLIQGGVAEMIRLAMQRMEGSLSSLGAGIVLQVHDEIVIEAPEKHAHRVAKDAKAIMEDFDFWLPPRVEVSWGTCFGKLVRMEGV